MNNNENARTRIAGYKPANRGKHEDLVQSSLQAFLQYLSDAGQHAIAKDIIDLEDDNAIFEYFFNVYTGLRTRSESHE